MAVDLLLGLQWGDEGKGKIVDVLTSNYDINFIKYHLYIEHSNQKHDKGIHDLCFGYPMFIHKDEFILD